MVSYTHMERFVLDTNLFFNMENGLGIGNKTEMVVVAVTKAMKKMKEEQRGEFFVPPKIIDEFLSFFDDKEQPFILEFISMITVKSPDLHTAQFPAIITWQLVDDVRTRNYRGQTAAEDEIKQAAQHMLAQETLDKKDFEIQLGPIVKRFRTKYRQATRFGFLDSAVDLELIVLAKEVEGFLVSTDEGVMKWGRIFGVKEMSAPMFGKKVTDENL